MDLSVSIGALARATGIPVETLRTWERRYGFPSPGRRESGHRRYDLSTVTRLQQVAQALQLGHRAADVVPASDTQLAALLSVRRTTAEPAPATADAGPFEPERLMPAIQRFDTERLRASLIEAGAALGPLRFVERRIAPLVHATGEWWASGRLDVRHEHFVSEVVSDVLRLLRAPLEDAARGPLIVLATLPGERHGLGLQMISPILAAAGCRQLLLGTEVSPDELATVAKDTGAAAVALSISATVPPAPIAPLITRLRGLLARTVALVTGGAGAPAGLAKVLHLPRLRDLDSWARRLK